MLIDVGLGLGKEGGMKLVSPSVVGPSDLAKRSIAASL